MCFQAQKQNTTCLIYKIKQNKRYWAVLSTTAESSLNNGVIIELLKKQTLRVRVRSVCPAPSAWKLCQLGFVTHIAQCWVFFYSCYFAALATPAVRRWVACSAGPHNIHWSSKAPGSRAWFFTSLFDTLFQMKFALVPLERCELEEDRNQPIINQSFNQSAPN